jgi:hypothetical protein
MSQSYVQWLSQNLAHPYLKTIFGSSREVYDVQRCPTQHLWGIFSPLVTGDNHLTVLGTLVIRVHYEFRGVRTDTQSLQLASDPQSLKPSLTINS